MATLIGVLVDVSGSMHQNVKYKGSIADEEKSWVRETFDFIDNIVKNDVSENEHVFVIGVGASCGDGIFDIINTVKDMQSLDIVDEDFDIIIENAVNLVEHNGAKDVRRWVKNHIIKESISYETAKVLYTRLANDTKFLHYFVYECLPLQCRKWEECKAGARAGVGGALLLAGLLSPFAIPLILAGAAGGSAIAATKEADTEDVKKVIEKAKTFMLKKINNDSVVSVQHASEILHEFKDENELSDERINKLMSYVDPFIYGKTPLIRALEEATKLFNVASFKNHKKLLIVISDGDATDGNSPPIARLNQLDVTTVCCYITQNHFSDPKRLYSRVQANWNDAAKFLFNLSSNVTTQLLPRTIFIKQGWEIDIENNEVKLFCQANNPMITKEFCNVIKNLVFSQDAIVDMMSSVSLDLLVNQHCEKFKAQEKQIGGTCYAHATAAIFYLATRRIIGREGGYPEFNQTRDLLVTKYGKDGAIPSEVFDFYCHQYRLDYTFLNRDMSKVLTAITAKRPVFAMFFLTDPEWDRFSDFYRSNPSGILTESVIQKKRRPKNAEVSGHAVVLVSYNSTSLRFMNSWGVEFADMGFFRVQNSKILDLQYFDIFWTENMLTEGEKNHYRKNGHKAASEFIQKLKGIQSMEYSCPLCRRKSLVSSFTGNALHAICPKCGNQFPTKEAGNFLSLNMYLISLSK